MERGVTEMNTTGMQHSVSETSKRILVATDLSAPPTRLSIGRHYSNVENFFGVSRRLPDLGEIARRQILDDLIDVAKRRRSSSKIACGRKRPRGETGSMPDRDRRARDELRSRFSPGATVDGTLRYADVPVPVVKTR